MMRKALLLALLLVAAVHSQNCESCKPATQIATCTDLHCYRCGKNEVLNLDSLNCVCKGDGYRINGVCGHCPTHDPTQHTAKQERVATAPTSDWSLMNYIFDFFDWIFDW